MTAEHLVTLIVAVFASSGFWAFLTAVFQKPQINEVLKEVSAVNDKVETLAFTVDRSNAITARTRILRFDDELYNKIRHSQEYFLQTYEDIDTYEDYCRQHPEFENNRAVDAIRHIKETYQKCRDEHAFV